MRKFSGFKRQALSCLDSYKLGHAEQYPEGTEYVYSNFTPRSIKHLNIPKSIKDDKIVFFGLQAFLLDFIDLWQETFFECDWEDIEHEASTMYAPFCGPKGYNTSRLKALWELGFMPLHIKALPEGSKVRPGTPVFTVTNTLPEFYWLPNYIESHISCELWKASVSATTSYAYRKLLEKYADVTGGSKDFIVWQAHDFSVRGMSNILDAAMSGAGHLLSFAGTDNLPAVSLINQCYAGKETFVGGSVPATEHSVMCAGGKETELETFRHILKVYPSGVVSIVSDTWNFWNVLEVLVPQLKEDILARTPDQFGLAKVVLRPDSGDPVKIITGYTSRSDTNIFDDPGYDAYRDRYGDYYKAEDWKFNEFGDTWVEEGSVPLRISERLGAVEYLYSIFGGNTNDRGFTTLDQHIGVIYGDSITSERAMSILAHLAAKGFASDNIVLGIGSYTFQYVTRDTLGFAMKATNVVINGVSTPIFKDPVTDDGTKKSATGLMAVHYDASTQEFNVKDNVTEQEEKEGALQTVFLNSYMYNMDTFADIRTRLNSI